MKKAVWSSLVAVLGLFALSTPVFAQQNVDTTSVNVQVAVSARAKLTLGASAITWPDANPDVTATLTSSAISLDVKARTSTAGNVTLTVRATDDLKNADNDIIDISGLTWTATAGFQGGTSNKTSAQTLGSWTGSGTRAGSHTYSLPNSWNYATGTYTTSLTYTLTAP